MAIKTLSVLIAVSDHPGVAIIIERFLRAKFYERFPTVGAAVSAADDASATQNALAFIDKALSELVLPGKAHAQTGFELPVAGALLLLALGLIVIYAIYLLILNVWNSGGIQVGSRPISVRQAAEASSASNDALKTIVDINGHPKSPLDPTQLAEELLAIESQLETYASNAWIVASQSNAGDANEEVKAVTDKLAEAHEKMLACLDGDEAACGAALELYRGLVGLLHTLIRAILMGKQVDPELLQKVVAALREALVILDDYGRALGPLAFRVFADFRVAICMVTEAVARGAVEDQSLVEQSFTSILMGCFRESLPKP
ncbi:MAG: hypothetical protein IPJ88_14065 [Myxococcales bacterium]|nr:MAG: hypothetical protein IPJ88_14065 [Myxococcales bacterium]